jgi:hypothetical protein
MAFYSECSLIVAIPPDYAKKDDLTRFLSSKLDGCIISVLEDPAAKEPFPKRAIIKEDSQLNSLQGTRDFASPGNPAPEESTSAEFLMGAAGEAIRDFLNR